MDNQVMRMMFMHCVATELSTSVGPYLFQWIEEHKDEALQLSGKTEGNVTPEDLSKNPDFSAILARAWIATRSDEASIAVDDGKGNVIEPVLYFEVADGDVYIDFNDHTITARGKDENEDDYFSIEFSDTMNMSEYIKMYLSQV